MTDGESRFPAENYQNLTDAGLLALIAPREFGGSGGKPGLSARAYHRVVKVARTTGDLAGEKDIAPQHVAESIQYRQLDRQMPV